MRRIIYYGVCALITFCIGIAIVLMRFHNKPEQVVIEPSTDSVLSERLASRAEDSTDYLTCNHAGAERMIEFGGRCVSVQRYMSNDDVKIRHFSYTFVNVAQAKREFLKALTGKVKLIERKPVMREGGVKLGEAAFTKQANSISKMEEFTESMWIEKDLYRSSSQSEKHLRAFVNTYKPDTFVDVCP